MEAGRGTALKEKMIRPEGFPSRGQNRIKSYIHGLDPEHGRQKQLSRMKSPKAPK